MGIRSFLAFELPPDIRSVVSRVSKEVRASRMDVKWVNVENIHLTIVFLGSVEEEIIHRMAGHIEKTCREYSSFDVRLEGMGLFPDIRRPRVIWLGLGGSIDRMSRFRDDIQEGLEPFGIKKEDRAFKPHITLGRFRNPGNHPGLREITDGYRNISSPVCHVDELVLFKSELRPSGAGYTRLNSWALTGAK